MTAAFPPQTLNFKDHPVTAVQAYVHLLHYLESAPLRPDGARVDDFEVFDRAGFPDVVGAMELREALAARALKHGRVLVEQRGHRVLVTLAPKQPLAEALAAAAAQRAA